MLDLLAAAKAHIEAGEHSEAVEKIEAALATIENEGVETANDAPSSPGDNPTTPPPLPGQGTNGAN